jgi:predicted Rossmann fold flavoprotein
MRQEDRGGRRASYSDQYRFNGASLSHVVIVGAGAAGLVAAIFAAREGARVTLLETTNDGGKKILISGGGRCNVLPSSLDAADYVTASSPHSLRKILLSWPLAEQRRFFEESLEIPLQLEAETGKLFPQSNRARDVRDSLVRAALEAGTTTIFGLRVDSVQPSADGWRISGGGGEWQSDAVVLATGGKSVPQTGSDGAGLDIAASMGHTVHTTYPALTPLLANPSVHAELAGLSLHARISSRDPRGTFAAEGGFLFTHRGYSGPAVLDISHLAVISSDSQTERRQLLVRWGKVDEAEWKTILGQSGGGMVAPLLRSHLPQRLVIQLLQEADVDHRRSLAQLRKDERTRLLSALTAYPLPWTGHEGYRKAEVTGGGIALSEIDPATTESRIQPGLFLCGEMLDAFGPIGGYNFAWAWATGRAAGLGAARHLQQ